MAPKKTSNRIVLPDLSAEESAKLDAVCKRLLAKAGNPDDATILGIEKAHYSIMFLNRMISTHAADPKVVALKFFDTPTVLEMLGKAGIDLRFDDDALLANAAEAGDWKAADYLVSFVGANPAKEELFRMAISARNRDLFGVLLSGLPDSEVGIWEHVGPDLVKHEAWQMITDVWRFNKVHFRHILAHSDLLRQALKSGANYLSFCSVKQLAADHIFPEFSDDESKPNKGLLPFIVRQLAAIRTAQLKQQTQEEEEELATTTPLKPSALDAYHKSEF